jgi:predicted DCC family thiol-disulfide oxidoreductase YuxK
VSASLSNTDEHVVVQLFAVIAEHAFRWHPTQTQPHGALLQYFLLYHDYVCTGNPVEIVKILRDLPHTITICPCVRLLPDIPVGLFLP